MTTTIPDIPIGLKPDWELDEEDADNMKDIVDRQACSTPIIITIHLQNAVRLSFTL
jgi:hypothetical protein